MAAKPTLTTEVGEPPAGVAPIGRLNDAGQSVLYLADSPDTAFSEARAAAGRYCLSEWRVLEPKVALANGGISLDILRKYFPNNFELSNGVLGGIEDPDVLDLFRLMFTLPVTSNPDIYRWSIASGLTSGFASVCGRTEIKVVDGNTHLMGLYPLSGIAYASVRKDKQAINFAFNNLGIKYVGLDHVQWVERHHDGSFCGLDIASSWDGQKINWQGRPAHFQLGPGGSARLVKVSETVWKYESHNGDIPFFV